MSALLYRINPGKPHRPSLRLPVHHARHFRPHQPETQLHHHGHHRYGPRPPRRGGRRQGNWTLLTAVLRTSVILAQQFINCAFIKETNDPNHMVPTLCKVVMFTEGLVCSSEAILLCWDGSAAPAVLLPAPGILEDIKACAVLLLSNKMSQVHTTGSLQAPQGYHSQRFHS